MIDISPKSFTPPPLLVPADRARDSPIISSSTGKLLTDFDAKQSPRFASKYQSRYRTRGKPRKLYPTTHALINYYPFRPLSFLLLCPFFLPFFFLSVWQPSKKHARPSDILLLFPRTRERIVISVCFKSRSSVHAVHLSQTDRGWFDEITEISPRGEKRISATARARHHPVSLIVFDFGERRIPVDRSRTFRVSS